MSTPTIEGLIHNMFVERITPVVDVFQTQIKALETAIENAEPAAPAVTTTTVQILEPNGNVKATIENTHEATPLIVASLNRRQAKDRNVYVHGPAGTSKTTTCEIIANANGWDVYYQKQSLTAYDLFGVRYPDGTVALPAFAECWINGGMVILDELHAWAPKAVISLNAAIANGVLDLSHLGLGMVHRHDECRIVGTGNTALTGLDAVYSAGEKQDGSTRDRFTFVYFAMDEALEDEITPMANWTKRVQRIRSVIQNRVRGNAEKFCLCSMRSSFAGAELLEQGISQEMVEEMVIFKGAGDAIKQAVYAEAGKPSSKAGKVINFEPLA